MSLSSLIYEDLVFALGKRGPVFCDGIFRVCSNFHNFFNVLSDDKGNDSVKGRSLDLDLSRKCKFVLPKNDILKMKIVVMCNCAYLRNYLDSRL